MMNVSRFPLSGIIFLVPLNQLGKRYPTNLDDVCECFYKYEKDLQSLLFSSDRNALFLQFCSKFYEGCVDWSVGNVLMYATIELLNIINSSDRKCSR